MKSKIAVSIMVLVGIALLVGCAKAPKVKVPAAEKVPAVVKAPELEGLYLTTEAKPRGSIPTRNSAKLGVGESVVVYALGQSPIETGGKWFELPADVIVTWKADRELEVTPTTGHVVTVKVVKPIQTSAYVTATTTDKEGKKIEKLFVVYPK